jgi:hypothetical protein
MTAFPPKENKFKLSFISRKVILVILLILGLILAGFFAARAFHGFQRVRAMKFGGGETNVELIRGWMTVNYITKMYHVPPDVVLSPLNLSEAGNGNRSISSLIRSTGTTDPDGMLDKVKASINDFQQKDMIPTPPHPDSRQEHP